MSTTPIAPVSLPTTEAAAYIGVAPDTLKAWRTRGRGPVYAKFGAGRAAKVVYRVADLDAFVSEARQVG